MKKSLIALAVAGVVSAPAFAATSNVDIYGVMSFSVNQMDTEQVAGTDSSDMNAGVDNVSRIGFKGSEDLGGGLKGIWQVETQLNADFADGGAMGALRNTFVGLSGGFGTVVMGRHDTPYKLATGALDPFADTIGDYNAIIGRSSAVGDSTQFDVRAPQTIAYISPTVSGFHAAVAYISIENPEAAGSDETSAYSLMGMYNNGPLFASLAYEKHDGGLVNNLAATYANNTGRAAWKLGLGYTMGDAKVGFVYEDQSIDPTGAGTALENRQEHSAYYLTGSYAMGPIVLKAAYGSADSGNGVGVDNGASFYVLGADYVMSKRTSVYAMYADLSNDGVKGNINSGSYDLKNTGAVGQTGGTTNGFSIGVKHTF